MPRYYFDVQNGNTAHDVDGIELTNLAEAEYEALRVLLDAAIDHVRERTGFDRKRPLAVTMRCGAKPAFKATLSIAVDRFQGAADFAGEALVPLLHQAENAEPLFPSKQRRHFDEPSRELKTDNGETQDRVFGKTVPAKTRQSRT